MGAPFAYNEDSGGLHIGVQSPATGPYAGNYAGYYGVHLDNAMLSHAVLTAPSRTVPSGYPNVGLYVQTGGTNIDYVVCAGTTSSGGTLWGAALATGFAVSHGDIVLLLDADLGESASQAGTLVDPVASSAADRSSS